MTTTPPAEGLSFYPHSLFTHSLTFNEWARLTAKDIHEGLHQRRGFEGQDVWFYSNHPIRWVRVVGIVVAYDDTEKMVNITVDDGSGYLMDLIAWKGKPPVGKRPKFSFDDLKNVGLHSIIKAKGSLGEFRGNKQLLLRRIAVLHDTNGEVDAWTETIKFKKNVLSKPWHLTEEFIREEQGRVAKAAEEAEKKEEKKRRKDERTLRKKEKELRKVLGKKKGKGEAVEGGAGGNHVGAGDVAAEISYRGRRREETPQLAASESIYVGRRHPSPRPWSPPVSLGPKPEDGSAPTLAGASRLSKIQHLNTHCSEPDEYGQEPDYKRRRCFSPALEPDLQSGSQRLEILESSFRGCRRSSRAPLQLTVSNVALLEHSTSSEFQAGDQLQPSVKAVSYVGRRRTGSESASVNQDLDKYHAPAKLETIPSSPPEVVRRCHQRRYSPSGLRIPHTSVFRDTNPKADLPEPMPERVPPSMESSTGIYRGRKRCTGSETASVVDPTVKRTKLKTVEPPPPPLPALAECPTEPCSYRGRRRRWDSETNSRLSRESSIFSNPVEEKSGCERWTGSTVPESFVLPPPSPSRDGDGPKYRGRRRTQVP
ncbi:unnamed protein product [Tuber aestivum]|uniref:CST complex subunit STN1 n=1 Tax=Tuber aestivum TaxID=59557 RepID=A0A292Q8L8_9PEZI|nr:unnamed protein product [Tuber aestivum]